MDEQMDNLTLKEFFNQIYNSYHQGVFAYILSRVENRDAAKDLMQEVFLRAWNQIHTAYEMGQENCRYWLFKITKNLIADYYRKNSSSNQAEKRMIDNVRIEKTYGKSPEELFEMNSNIHCINNAIERLPDQLRVVLLLHFIGQMKSNEIGEVLDIPAGTVRYRLSKARQLIRQELAKDDLIREGQLIE